MSPSSLELLVPLLLNCVCERLTLDGRPTCTCAVRHAIQWPSVAECCKCDAGGIGQAWARLVRVEPFGGTPNADGTDCGGAVLATIDVGTHRCVKAIVPGGGAPSAAVYTQDALALIGDEFSLRKAIACCPQDIRTGPLRGWSWKATTSLPLGPLGGCGGVVVTVTAQGVPRAGP